jgi:hypothetical protein
LSEECEMSEWREAAAAGVVKKAVEGGERESVCAPSCRACPLVSIKTLGVLLVR